MTPVASPIVVGFGELLWDCFGTQRKPGGAPANVAFHVSRLGGQGIVCSRAGNDALGQELLSFLQRQGLSTRFVQLDPDRPTGTVTVHLEQKDGPAYTIHQDVAWDRIAWNEELASLMASASAICFGTLAQRTQQNRVVLQQCLQAAPEALKVYDINLRPPFTDINWILPSLEAADVLKLNDGECASLRELLDLPALPPDAFAQHLNRRFNLRLTCITRGAAGCLLVSDGEVVDAPGRPVTVVDTVGSGDAFTAALIMGILQEWPLAEIALRANCLGVS